MPSASSNELSGSFTVAQPVAQPVAPPRGPIKNDIAMTGPGTRVQLEIPVPALTIENEPS